MKPALIRGPFVGDVLIAHGVLARRSPVTRESTGWTCKLATLMVFVGASFAVPGFADRVVLTNGNVLEGRAERQENGDVRLSSEFGVLTLRAETIRRVEASLTAEDEIRSDLDRASGSAPELLQLARRALAERAETLGRKLLQRVLDLDSDHAEARRLLGYVRTEHGWELAEDVQRRTRPPRVDRLTATDIAILRVLMNAPPTRAAAPPAQGWTSPYSWPPVVSSGSPVFIGVPPVTPPAAGPPAAPVTRSHRAASRQPTLHGSRHRSSSFRRGGG